MLDLAEMARAKPGTWRSMKRGDFASIVAVLLFGFLAWQSQATPLALLVVFMLVVNLATRVQEANERRAQRQLELILTVLRDLQRRTPVTNDQGV